MGGEMVFRRYAGMMVLKSFHFDDELLDAIALKVQIGDVLSRLDMVYDYAAKDDDEVQKIADRARDNSCHTRLPR